MLKIVFTDDLVMIGSIVIKSITKAGQKRNVLKLPTKAKTIRTIDIKLSKYLEILLEHIKYTSTPEKNNRAHSKNKPS